MDAPHYSLFNGGLPHDIMHDVLEGVAPLEISLLLCHCIICEKYLTLDEYNHRLSHFDYEYLETSRAPPINTRSILSEGRALKASASQMLLLIRILPLMIGDTIPNSDPNWKCFILLTKIVDILVSPWSSADLCAIF